MIELKVSGQKFSGWKTASVTRAINLFASYFEVSLSQKSLAVPLDAPCQIFVDGLLVMTGYIDEIKPNYAATSHEITFSGRSKTADLVDCAAIFDTGQIINDELSSIITKIIQPFGIKLVFNPTGSFPIVDFQLQQGETAAAAIERLCAMHSLIYHDDAEGNLVISQAKIDLPIGTLIHKVSAGAQNNILSGGCAYSHRDRFSEYIVKSQIPGSDETGGEELSTEGRSKDQTISRYRPMLLLAESSMDNEKAKGRAIWEKSNRIGKSLTLGYTVQGWKNGIGSLWQPNSYVAVDDDFVQIKGKLIISAVTFNISADSGTTSALQLSPPQAFIPATSEQEIRIFQGWSKF